MAKSQHDDLMTEDPEPEQLLTHEEFPFRFRHNDDSSETPTIRVAAIDVVLARAAEWLVTLRKPYEDIAREVKALKQKTSLDPFREDEIQNRETSMRQLERGVRQWDGVTDERVESFRGEPGLHLTEAVIRSLHAERDEWAPYLVENVETKAKYRLRKSANHVVKGPDGAMRMCKPGEVVELTLRQYRAWKDQFEPVDKPEEPKKKREPLTVSEPQSSAASGHTTDEVLRKRARQDAR